MERTPKDAERMARRCLCYKVKRLQTRIAHNEKAPDEKAWQRVVLDKAKLQTLMYKLKPIRKWVRAP